ncbi:MAG: S16 family serine protease [Clostridia bacterium]|nr:S16 family serine protease [Clostridia bacterium]
MTMWIWLVVQVLFFVALWYWSSYRRRPAKRAPAKRSMSGSESRELMDLKRMRARSLSLPLSEKTRPVSMEDIIGQAEGVKALRAAMCGPNPQHVIIYGPPGCGKTCAARLVLEEAKKREDSPFDERSLFVEVDATCVRFDERAIADPLMGSVHDPIYQGAGALGNQGVPQPKPGAVSRAHCGVLFLDEIGELHPLQMNKLLKVLEDRRVYFDSAYYSKDNPSIPPHIHDIFQNGLPADFRLVGATTRSPEDMPPALRSRCMELHFRALSQSELEIVVQNAAKRLGFAMDKETVRCCASYCQSGRDAVNIVQLAGGVAYGESRKRIQQEDIAWVARVTHLTRCMLPHIPAEAKAGVCCGLAVTGMGQGMIIEIECTVTPARQGLGTLEIGGAVCEEELDMRQKKLRRKSTACTSVENVRDAFRVCFGVDCAAYDIRFNVPGGMPMDGPSAGIAFAAVLMSALCKKAPMAGLALTGEITVQGEVRPVGGVREKVEAAINAGAKTIVIPEANWEDAYAALSANVVPVGHIVQVMRIAFGVESDEEITRDILPFVCSA